MHGPGTSAPGCDFPEYMIICRRQRQDPERIGVVPTANAGETAEYISNAPPTEGTHSSSQTALAALRAKSQELRYTIYYILYKNGREELKWHTTALLTALDVELAYLYGLPSFRCSGPTMCVLFCPWDLDASLSA
jgi:hypothetical protein